MPEIGPQIRAERTRTGMTLAALAARLGCSKGQLSLMESGRRTVSIERARRIEQELCIGDSRLVKLLRWNATSPEIRAEMSAGRAMAARLREAARRGELDQMLDSGELRDLVEQTSTNIEDPIPLTGHVPVINKVAAGYPTEFTDLGYPARVADEYIACPDVSDPDAFAARVVGDSMAPAYRESEIVVFSPTLPTPDGSDCFVRLSEDDETTFKRIYFEDDGAKIRLQPVNRRYPPRIVDREAVSGIYAAAYVMRKVG